jgi:hypothetical protein
VWTLRTLRLLALHLQLIPTISRETVRKALRQSRYTYRRVQEFTPSPDPDYRQKKHWRDVALRQMHRPGWAVLFPGETGNFAVKPRQGYNWMSATDRITVPEVEEREQRVGVYGIFNAATGHVQWRCTTSRTAETTIDFLKMVVEHYHAERYLVITWDNAPGHISQDTRQWVADWNVTAHQRKYPKLVLIHLPVKAAWLNRIEPVWWGMFRSVIAGQTFTSPQEMGEAIDDYFMGRNERLAVAA